MSEPMPGTARRRRRSDYPEPQYAMPRSRIDTSSAPVSPLTRAVAPLPFGSVGSCEQGMEIDSTPRQDSSATSPESLAAMPAVEAASSANAAQTQLREPATLRAPVDSKVEPSCLGLQHKSAGKGTAPGHYAPEEQCPTVASAKSDLHSRHRLSDIFSFGAGNKPAASAPVLEPPRPKKYPRSLRLWGAKTPTSHEASPPMRSRFVEHLETTHRRFDSLRNSIAELPASIKQMAGRKRSRQDEEEDDALAVEEDRGRKIARTARSMPAPQLAELNFEAARMVSLEVSLPAEVGDADLPHVRRREGPFFPRPPTLDLTDPEVMAMIEDIRRGFVAVKSEFRTRERSPQPVWTGRERREFGAYVRAAESEGWEMDCD